MGGELKTTHFPDGSTKRFTYNPAGQLTQAQNLDSDLTYQYDPLGRLTQVDDLLKHETILYGYDRDANTVTQTYGKLGEVLEAADSDEHQASFEYDSLMRETKRRLSNGMTNTQQWDDANRLVLSLNTQDAFHGPNRTHHSFAYLYNKAGQRTAQLDEKGRLTSYEYDQAG